MLQRLQKILSARGICSRRKAEEYIERGLVKVNGTVATIGDKADPDTDTIEVDGTVTEERKELLYYLMHKPEGVETSNVEWQKNTVRTLLPKELQGTVYPVGRLDKDSCGLLLFTNDGALAYRLTHPKFEHEKEYEVTTKEPMTPGQLQKMRDGLKILGSKTKPALIVPLGPERFSITLTEGRNRQIRRMVQKVGGEVASLKRVRIVNIQDESLTSGSVRQLSESEVCALLQSTNLE